MWLTKLSHGHSNLVKGGCLPVEVEGVYLSHTISSTLKRLSPDHSKIVNKGSPSLLR